MQYVRTPPRRPRIEDEGIDKWLDDRQLENNELDARVFRILVGPDPKKPRIGVVGLMKAFNRKSTHTIYRWLRQLDREMRGEWRKS